MCVQSFRGPFVLWIGTSHMCCMEWNGDTSGNYPDTPRFVICTTGCSVPHSLIKRGVPTSFPSGGIGIPIPTAFKAMPTSTILKEIGHPHTLTRDGGPPHYPLTQHMDAHLHHLARDGDAHPLYTYLKTFKVKGDVRAHIYNLRRDGMLISTFS